MSDSVLLEPPVGAAASAPAVAPTLTPLGRLLRTFREAAQTEREKGTYFEELIVYYLRHEPAYRERQCVKVDKDSGIVNDANDWAIETMGNPRYPLELFLHVVTVSLRTMEIVRGLPGLDIQH